MGQLAQPTEDEKTRARHHLGYLNVSAASTFSLGVPAAVQTQFLIENALNLILMTAYPQFQKLLCELDRIECQLLGGSDLADVSQVDTIQIDPMRIEKYGKLYKIPQQALANLLGIVSNPWDQREWLQGPGVNVRVNH